MTPLEEARPTSRTGEEKNALRRRIGLYLGIALLVGIPSPFLQPQVTSAEYHPENVKVGAWDPNAWNGIVFESEVARQRLPFALRVGSKSGGDFLDGDRIFPAVSLVGPHAPDGSYALIGWRHSQRAALITLEWSRYDETTVVGRLKAPPDVQLVLEAYSPYRDTTFLGAYRISADQTQMEGNQSLDGVFRPVLHFLVVTDRPVLASGGYANIAQLRKAMESGSLADQKDRFPEGAAGLQFVTDKASSAHFVAAIGANSSDLSQRAKPLLEPGRIDALLDQNAANYSSKRPHIQGLFTGAPEAIGNSMFWNTLYVSSLRLQFPSISRRWANFFGGWVVGEWDCFFGSLLTNVEDARQTSAAVRAILLAQSPTGVVPNVDGGSGTSPDRSQPPVGAYVVWKNFAKAPDRELLQWAYPRLKKWHQWWFRDRGDGQPWRDGNRDGLLEWGSDQGSTPSVGGRGFLKAAKWESGMDDSPMYDEAQYHAETYTMDLDDVGLNSLYALDSECLARIALVLGEKKDQAEFTTEYERMKALVRQKLWNEQDGMYENRFWDGRFSQRLSPTNFYPMLAGIATNEQAMRMVREHLVNAKQFWGPYVIPTISRDDPAFPDQYYWRGDIWGPTNFLVYEGINRYHEDEVAFQFAEKSYQLFMDDWQTHQHTNEQYYAWGGSAGGDTHYTWGALLRLLPLEQYIDETPWDGLRWGALHPPRRGSLTGMIWNRHHYKVDIGPEHTVVQRDGEPRFEADASVVVRDYTVTAKGLAFVVKSLRPVQIISREYSSGVVAVKLDGHPVQTITVQHGAIVLRVAAGEHRIEATRTGSIQ